MTPITGSRIYSLAQVPRQSTWKSNEGQVWYTGRGMGGELGRDGLGSNLILFSPVGFDLDFKLGIQIIEDLGCRAKTYVSI